MNASCFRISVQQAKYNKLTWAALLGGNYIGLRHYKGTVASSSSVTGRVLAEISTYLIIQSFKSTIHDLIFHSLTRLIIPSSVYSKVVSALTSLLITHTISAKNLQETQLQVRLIYLCLFKVNGKTKYKIQLFIYVEYVVSLVCQG